MLIAFAAVAILSLDPLGIKTATNAQSEFIYQRFFSSYVYDQEPHGAGPEGRRAATVVLVDQAFLDAFDDDWPARYDTQADLVDAIASYEPAAMFLDFAYIDQHDSDAALARYAETLGSYRGEGGSWLSMTRLTVAREQRGCCSGEVERVAGELVDPHGMLAPIRELALPNGFMGWG